jgi:hypothetical protein
LKVGNNQKARVIALTAFAVFISSRAAYKSAGATLAFKIAERGAFCEKCVRTRWVRAEQPADRKYGLLQRDSEGNKGEFRFPSVKMFWRHPDE